MTRQSLIFISLEIKNKARPRQKDMGGVFSSDIDFFLLLFCAESVGANLHLVECLMLMASLPLRLTGDWKAKYAEQWMDGDVIGRRRMESVVDICVTWVGAR
jgi:hypothetical protein